MWVSKSPNQIALRQRAVRFLASGLLLVGRGRHHWFIGALVYEKPLRPGSLIGEYCGLLGGFLRSLLQSFRFARGVWWKADADGRSCTGYTTDGCSTSSNKLHPGTPDSWGAITKGSWGLAAIPCTGGPVQCLLQTLCFQRRPEAAGTTSFAGKSEDCTTAVKQESPPNMLPTLLRFASTRSVACSRSGTWDPVGFSCK